MPSVACTSAALGGPLHPHFMFRCHCEATFYYSPAFVLNYARFRIAHALTSSVGDCIRPFLARLEIETAFAAMPSLFAYASVAKHANEPASVREKFPSFSCQVCNELTYFRGRVTVPRRSQRTLSPEAAANDTTSEALMRRRYKFMASGTQSEGISFGNSANDRFMSPCLRIDAEIPTGNVDGEFRKVSRSRKMGSPIE